jgi:hypothetical protein
MAFSLPQQRGRGYGSNDEIRITVAEVARFFDLPNLQVVNRDVRAAKCANEARDRQGAGTESAKPIEARSARAPKWRADRFDFRPLLSSPRLRTSVADYGKDLRPVLGLLHSNNQKPACSLWVIASNGGHQK